MAGRHAAPEVVELRWNREYISVFISSALVAATPLLVFASGVNRLLIDFRIAYQGVSLLLLALAPVGAFVGAKRAHQRSSIHLGWSICLGVTGLVAAILTALYVRGWLLS
ncbi:MAG: hypothetical protein R3258_02705 [Acidimicrobiia bacterium]|nr:hypothetical protein [Acidimicrobiia bacterium]